jgi:peptide chain release factor 1
VGHEVLKNDAPYHSPKDTEPSPVQLKSMIEKLREIERRFSSIEEQLQDPAVVMQPKELQRLGKARAEISDIVEVIRRYEVLRKDYEDAEALLSDPEMKELAQAEYDVLKVQIPAIEEELRLMLIPKDPNDEKSVIMEVEPGAGGDEAALFANELFRLYLRYCERRKWKVDIIENEESGVGGLKKAVFKIEAKGAYSQLKHESGVHRVQRVPATESSGRTHTSTAKVSVMPEAEELDVEIKNDDLEISTYCSSSAGGQHMQKNETAIRIIHKPSGIVVTCQDERSQLQNKFKAMEVLRAKIYAAQVEKAAAERGETRKNQIGTGDRSEKIRTYNFPQSRITDHRIGLDMHNTVTFMDGDIQAMIDALIQDDQARKLAEGDSV